MRKAFKFFFNSMLILAGLFWLSSCSMFNEPPYQSDTMTSVIIKDSHINEASGLTRSRRDNNVLWVNNDSGNAAEIYAINPQGERLATVTIPDIDLEWLDWEDMASFEMDGKAYLMIADVGDNLKVTGNTICILLRSRIFPNIKKVKSSNLNQSGSCALCMKMARVIVKPSRWTKSMARFYCSPNEMTHLCCTVYR
ncbi:hypothetical protein ACFSJQ_04085 [Vibrio olivae]